MCSVKTFSVKNSARWEIAITGPTALHLPRWRASVERDRRTFWLEGITRDTFHWREKGKGKERGGEYS